MSVLPAIFVGHGAAVFTANPGDATHRWLTAHGAALRALAPRAVVVVSAHFASDPVRVTAAARPETIHDHPASHLYETAYPAPGAPDMAGRVRALLAEAGIACEEDARRGLDHGAWVPLSLLLPAAGVPVLQLSLHAAGDPQFHVALGQALAPLRSEGVVLLGSGGVTHNQDEFRRAYFAGEGVAEVADWSRDFDARVTAAFTELRGAARTDALLELLRTPAARRAHPTNEHFLPLLVVAGAGGADAGEKLFEGFQHSLSTSAFAAIG